MHDVLSDLSPPALARATKANLYEFFRYLGRSARVDFYESQSLIRWRTPVPHPWFNGVLVRTAPPEKADQTIEGMAAYFKSQNVEPFTWWLEPGLQATGWGKYLLAHGFGYDENTPGMAVDLSALNEDVKAPPNFTIVPVEDLEALKEWTQTFIAGYQLPPAWEAGLFDLMSDLGLDLPIRNYLGYIDGKPVATSHVFLGAGVAGIYFVATVPEARGQGLGAAITLAPLREARAMGYRAGILQSSEMGFSIYRRLGFQKLCNMEHYFWTSKSG